jgi:hypothetical protein
MSNRLHAIGIGPVECNRDRRFCTALADAIARLAKAFATNGRR